jgi:hypothetical protein
MRSSVIGAAISSFHPDEQRHDGTQTKSDNIEHLLESIAKKRGCSPGASTPGNIAATRRFGHAGSRLRRLKGRGGRYFVAFISIGHTVSGGKMICFARR